MCTVWLGMQGTTPAYKSEIKQDRILYLDASESAKSESNMQSDLPLSSL